MNAITKAIAIVGLAELARRMDVTYQAIRKWEASGKAPAERCRKLVESVDMDAPGAITLSDLRADLWPCHVVPRDLPHGQSHDARHAA